MSEKLMIRYHKTRDGHVKMEWPPIEFPSAFILIVRSLPLIPPPGRRDASRARRFQSCAGRRVHAPRGRNDDEHLLHPPWSMKSVRTH